MLCSVCKKNMAVIFINKLDKDGKQTDETTGLCIDCAKKQGIDPLANILKGMENISDEDMENMSKQFDSLLGEFSNGEDFDQDDEDSSKSNFGLHNLFGSFGKNSKNKSDDIDDTKEKATNSKIKKTRKTKYLDTFGENLTQKARENKLDKVIGREKELARMIQILN